MASSVRAPAVAGMFYPGNKADLAKLVDQLLESAEVPPHAVAPKAIIVPHAGYVYSGPIAATAFKLFEPIADRVERIVLIGPAHRVYLDGLASPDAAALATPLGQMPIELEAIAKCPEITHDALAHAREHSLEVMVPFLQRVTPKAKLVPLVVGHASPEAVGNVIDRLWGGFETRFVLSSDLSHYLSYEEGRLSDTRTSRRICSLGPQPVGFDEACGAAGINGLVWVARHRHLRAELLDLRSSGDTAGPRDEVVGYGAFAFFEEAPPP
ncbi:MAG: AmmeMemoRadiSam system protein B [Polyangiaceae bacterium]|nr:AmmeMemoRadiSam system protein B [Polyangiaceae bacterium]